MPRVHTQKARNDIYSEGKLVKDPKTKSGKRLDRSKPANKNDEIIVKKGETYYWWKFRYGSKHISTTRPKQSQLTQSAYLSTLYDIQDRLNAVRNSEDADSMGSEVEDIISELESLRDEQEEKKSNMPDSLQESPTGELLQERYDALDSAIGELQGIYFDYDEPEEEELKQEAIDELGYTEDEADFTDEQNDEIVDIVERLKTEKFEEWKNEKADEVEGISFD